jgi:hypothetical protein
VTVVTLEKKMVVTNVTREEDDGLSRLNDVTDEEDDELLKKMMSCEEDEFQEGVR